MDNITGLQDNWFIMVWFSDGRLKMLDDHIPAGYKSERDAQLAMVQMREDGVWEFQQPDYFFAVMHIYQPK